jgi:hypothetical protein
MFRAILVVAVMGFWNEAPPIAIEKMNANTPRTVVVVKFEYKTVLLM